MNDAITTSRSAYVSHQECPRRRWWAYEAPNGTDVRGWERRALALPLATGIYTHKVIERLLKGDALSVAVAAGVTPYRAEATARGLQIESAGDLSFVIDEQAALIEALGRAWARFRLPTYWKEYEVVDVEREEVATLSPDAPVVKLQARCDAVLRRKADGNLFVFNAKTVGDAGDRWYANWETDSQLLTEALAVEQRMGERVAGVIIEGLIKGRRVKVDESLKEIRRPDQPVWGYIQASRLLYGYRTDANPPIQPALYDYEGTTRKGWYKFATWRNDFGPQAEDGPIAHWVNWLPPEVIEAQFAIVPPILRNQAMVESKVRQIVATERRIAQDVAELGLCAAGDEAFMLAALDSTFPQNEHACGWPSRCPMYDICWCAGVSKALLMNDGSGLYVPRTAHHKSLDSNEG